MQSSSQISNRSSVATAKQLVEQIDMLSQQPASEEDQALLLLFDKIVDELVKGTSKDYILLIRDPHTGLHHRKVDGEVNDLAPMIAQLFVSYPELMLEVQRRLLPGNLNRMMESFDPYI